MRAKNLFILSTEDGMPWGIQVFYGFGRGQGFRTMNLELARCMKLTKAQRKRVNEAIEKRDSYV